jgi:HAMP domain-containing protein
MEEAKESDAVQGLRWLADYIHPTVLGEAVRRTLIAAADEIEQLQDDKAELEYTINNMANEIDVLASAFNEA